ncbi:hypothetical protein V8E51_016548 [Hyaloscypha variabilis]
MGSVLYTTMAFSSAELSTRELYSFSLGSSDGEKLYPLSDFTLGTWGQPLSCTEAKTTFFQPLHATNVLPDASALASFLKTFNVIYAISSTHFSWPSYPGGAIKPYTVTYNPCSPMLSVPTKLLAANSVWHACRMGISAFFDPPIFLTAGGSFQTVDKPTTALTPYGEQLSETGVPAAVAGYTLAPAIASKTIVSGGLGLGDPPAPTAQGFVLDSQTLAAGGPGVTISGTVVRILDDGSSVEIGSTETQAIGSFIAAQEGEVWYLFGSKTLSAGGAAITVDGTVVSLLAGGSSLVVGSRTEGVSVLGVSTRSANGGVASATRAGFQQTSSSQSCRTSTSAAATVRHGENWSRILGVLTGMWMLSIGLS